MSRRHRGKDVKRAVRVKLVADGRGSKELNYWIMLDGKKVTRVTLPKGDGELSPGTDNSVRNQLLLSTSEYDDLVVCPMTGPKYYELLRAKQAAGLL